MTEPFHDLKRAFIDNQLPDLEIDLRAFIDSHPIYSALPRQDRDFAASAAATQLLLAIRPQSVVGLVR